jgi:hypothetical protein
MTAKVREAEQQAGVKTSRLLRTLLKLSDDTADLTEPEIVNFTKLYRCVHSTTGKVLWISGDEDACQRAVELGFIQPDLRADASAEPKRIDQMPLMAADVQDLKSQSIPKTDETSKTSSTAVVPTSSTAAVPVVTAAKGSKDGTAPLASAPSAKKMSGQRTSKFCLIS